MKAQEKTKVRSKAISLELLLAKWRYGWILHTIYGASQIIRWFHGLISRFYDSFDPEAEKTCEDLLSLALQIDPGNPEALQTLASVRLSQQRPEDAKHCVEQAWSAWKDLDLGS